MQKWRNWLIAVYLFTSAGSQITDPVAVYRIRWVGATTPGHELILTESTAGDRNRQVFRTIAAGSEYVEESSVLEHVPLRKGIRIQTMGSGQLWIYTRE